MKTAYVFQAAACGFLTTAVGAMTYFSARRPEGEVAGGDRLPTMTETFDTVTKEPTRSWYRLHSDGNWTQLRPEFEQSVEDAYCSGESEVDLGKYTIHFNSDRGEWKYWIENTEKETFTKLKYEEV